MFISYTVKSHQFKETSKGRGIVSYEITDEHGNKRIVSALAQLGMFNKIKKKSVRPIHKRELPLIQALIKSSVNDKIEVDFTDFNSQNPRESTAKDIGVREKEIPDDFQDHTIHDIDEISRNKFRVFQLAALGALVLAALMSVSHSFF